MKWLKRWWKQLMEALRRPGTYVWFSILILAYLWNYHQVISLHLKIQEEQEVLERLRWQYLTVLARYHRTLQLQNVEEKMRHRGLQAPTRPPLRLPEDNS